MFNSKEPSDCKLIQLWDAATISVTDEEHESVWHYSRRLHQGSFPPSSLLVLVWTRRHANRDTHLKLTGEFARRMHSELNPLISCQCVFRVATETLQTCSIATSGTFSLTPVHLKPVLGPTHSSQNLLDCR